ncbi:DUF6350 family protein [Agromyces archimandritae]|uniref:Uncharacterized protein n=1 Tax=Agromyces archimandritae TaxID=2781962 RepID=A0A975FL46_9MICO|nr:DUF6350 family protein [Agromyces archimandritae]QTX03912.1 hypothetical protein G127AT_11415 [Agromyces archimandritae]
MNRTPTVLLSALEAIVAAAAGIGLAFVPLTLLWAFDFHTAAPFGAFWEASGNVWLLGHGVDVGIRFAADFAASFGVPGAAEPFTITIALLGFALITLLAGRRIGARAAAAGHPLAGLAAAVVVFAAAGSVVTATSGSAIARPVVWQGVLLPALVIAAGVAIGACAEWLREHEWTGRGEREAGRAPDAPRGWISGPLAGLPSTAVTGIRTAFTGGVAAAFGIVGVAAAAVAVVIIADYATIAGLYQALQPGVMGGIALTLAELAVLPNIIVWAVSWLLGPGFSIGVGTTVSPGGTVLGPIPGLPILGGVPRGELAFGFLGLLVPIVLGFLAGYFVFRRAVRDDEPWWMPVAAGLGMGLVGGLLLGVLAAASGGAAGPGRLAAVGPDALAVGAVAALAIGVPAILGCGAAHRAFATDPVPFRERWRRGGAADASGARGASSAADAPRAAGGEPGQAAGRDAQTEPITLR